jgi:hypothetical protein
MFMYNIECQEYLQLFSNKILIITLTSGVDFMNQFRPKIKDKTYFGHINLHMYGFTQAIHTYVVCVLDTDINS